MDDLKAVLTHSRVRPSRPGIIDAPCVRWPFLCSTSPGVISQWVELGIINQERECFIIRQDPLGQGFERYFG